MTADQRPRLRFVIPAIVAALFMVATTVLSVIPADAGTPYPPMRHLTPGADFGVGETRPGPEGTMIYVADGDAYCARGPEAASHMDQRLGVTGLEMVSAKPIRNEAGIIAFETTLVAPDRRYAEVWVTRVAGGDKTQTAICLLGVIAPPDSAL